MAKPIGREFVVNEWWESFQNNPDITRLANGNVVVVWDSRIRVNDRDINTQYVGGRVYAPDGTPLTGEIILSDPSLFGNYARVDALPGGGIAVAWEAGEGSVLARTDIYTARFGDDLERVGPIRRVSPAIDDDFFAPEVVARRDGGHVVIYSGNEERADGRFAGDGVYARAYGPDGRPDGGLRHLSSAATGFDQTNPRAARLSNGDMVVIYDSELSTINKFGNPVDDLRGRILAPDGRPRGPEFVLTRENDGVNGGFNLTDTSISVAALSGGRFVATWYNTELEGNPGGATSYQILGRIFDSRGRPEGRPFQVNDFDTSVPDHSSVAALDGGGFVVVYDHASPTSDVYEDVFGQLYSEWGRRVGGNFVVPSSLPNAQEWPSVTGLKGGGFAVAYESEFLDGESDAIAARIFEGLTPSEVDRGAPARGGIADRARRIEGTPGDDVLHGGNGDDRLSGRGGDDRLRGFGGDDRLLGGAGDDRLEGGPGRDRLSGGPGRDRLLGGSGDDRLEGGSGGDLLRGGSGDDRLLGGAGDDRLFGGAGRDWLHGARGRDVLDGGPGRDVFVFERGDGRDVVRDFDPGTDALRLDDALWRGDLSARQVVGRFGKVQGGDAVLDFGRGDVLVLRGIEDPRDVVGDLVIV